VKQRSFPTNDVMSWSTASWHGSGTRQQTDRDQSSRQCDSARSPAAQTDILIRQTCGRVLSKVHRP
jgi:hypothetical protein